MPSTKKILQHTARHYVDDFEWLPLCGIIKVCFVASILIIFTRPNIRLEKAIIYVNKDYLISKLSTKLRKVHHKKAKTLAKTLKNKRRSLFFRRSKKRFISNGLILANVVLVVSVGAFVFSQHRSSNLGKEVSFQRQDQIAAIDQVSSVDIAVEIAKTAKIAEAPAVRNNAITINAQLTIVPSDEKVVSKPQIVNTSLKSKKDIKKYTTVSGDTIALLAKKFGVSADSLRWSNGVEGDVVAKDKVLWIPPSEGIVYEVKDGDTVDSLVARFKSSKEQVVAYNDLESAELKKGDRVMLPDGKIAPVVIVPRGGSVYAGYAFGSAPIYYSGASNGYDFGNCTWYVANKRSASGRPVPSNFGNAITWKVIAQRAGLSTGPTPAVGAVAWKAASYGYGHVAYVEAVNADGSFLISEMNVVGFNRTSSQTISAGNTGSYYFIY